MSAGERKTRQQHQFNLGSRSGTGQSRLHAQRYEQRFPQLRTNRLREQIGMMNPAFPGNITTLLRILFPTPDPMPRQHCSLRVHFSAALLLTAFFLAGNAHAEWLFIGRNENFRAYLDQTSLQRNGERTQVLQLMDFVTAQWADERTVIGSIKSTVEYDCAQPRMRTVALEAYSEQMSGGRRVASEQLPNADWEGIKPGSTNEKVRQLVCGK